MLEGGINRGITLTRDGKEIHFGEKVHTTKGVLFMAKIRHCPTPGTRLGMVSVLTRPRQGSQPGQSRGKLTNSGAEKETTMLTKRTLHVNTTHQLLGHMGERATQAVGKHLGWTIMRSAY